MEPVSMHGHLQHITQRLVFRIGRWTRDGVQGFKPGLARVCPSDTKEGKERILDLAATQLEDGGTYHQYQPLTKKGNHEIGGDFNDDPLWLVLATAAYIKETGDFNILEEYAPFNNDINKSDSIYEHLRRAFKHVTENLGPHGLPLIGRADWNDCLNLNCYSQHA